MIIQVEYRLTKRRLCGQVERELSINKGARTLFQIDFRAKQAKCSPRRCRVATRNGRSIGCDSEELDGKGGYSALSEIRGETARERKRRAELMSGMRVCTLLAARLFVNSAHFWGFIISRPKIHLIFEKFVFSEAHWRDCSVVSVMPLVESLLSSRTSLKQ